MLTCDVWLVAHKNGLPTHRYEHQCKHKCGNELLEVVLAAC